MSDMDRRLDQMRKDFANAGIVIDTDFRRAIETACIIVEDSAVQLVPVDTGLLKKSINRRLITRKGVIIGQVGTNVEYAPFQEFGTSKMKARPFLTPALKMNQSRIEKIIAGALDKSIDKVDKQ